MTTKAGKFILFGMIVGAVLGALGGYLLSGLFLQIQFLGTMFLNALKVVVVPLIVASMIMGVASLGDIRRLGRTTAKTLAYYLVTTGFAVIIGIVLVNIIQPGQGVDNFGAFVPDIVAQSHQKTLIDVIESLIPSNIIDAAAKNSILPLIVFSLAFGAVLTTIGEKGKPVIAFFDGLNHAVMRLVTYIIYFAPIGVMALIGGIVAENRGSVEHLISSLAWYTVTVIAGLLIHAFVVLPLILKVYAKRNPFDYFLNMGEALATAFT
ncbi:MAG TPA: dicarboxylate/amino acid:cation symporter, partial [candidate division Zixibacteria bacterium]|nr:dicarboxylate/amino acid:cation symporter [candidate division Zixibacteria bacterium]